MHDGVDAATVGAYGYDDQVKPLLGGGLLSDRLRATHDGHVPAHGHEQPAGPPPGADVSLGAATQIEIDAGEVRFLVPFSDSWPSEYWLKAFRRASAAWPSHLVQPCVDEGRGLQMGPLPVARLEEHVQALKDLVAEGNRVYVDEIEPELRRQREEALRREQEAERLQAEVESKLKLLLG